MLPNTLSTSSNWTSWIVFHCKTQPHFSLSHSSSLFQLIGDGHCFVSVSGCESPPPHAHPPNNCIKWRDPFVCLSTGEEMMENRETGRAVDRKKVKWGVKKAKRERERMNEWWWKDDGKVNVRRESWRREESCTWCDGRWRKRRQSTGLLKLKMLNAPT